MNPEELFLEHQWLPRYVCRRLGSHDEDEISEAQMQMWICAHIYKDKGAKFSTYAIKCCINAILKNRRKKFKYCELEDQLVIHEDWLCVQEFVDLLNGREREFLIHALEGRNNAEIARLYNTTRQTVHRVLNNIKRKYLEYDK